MPEKKPEWQMFLVSDYIEARRIILRMHFIRENEASFGYVEQVQERAALNAEIKHDLKRTTLQVHLLYVNGLQYPLDVATLDAGMAIIELEWEKYCKEKGETK